MARVADLADCGRRPNCVSSNASDPRRRLGPWRLASAPEEVWSALIELVEATPRTRIVASSDDLLHAESRSRIFRFVDDLEVALDTEAGLLAMRSASRLGYSDRGVNRRRVLRLARLLAERALIAA